MNLNELGQEMKRVNKQFEENVWAFTYKRPLNHHFIQYNPLWMLRHFEENVPITIMDQRNPFDLQGVSFEIPWLVATRGIE